MDFKIIIIVILFIILAGYQYTFNKILLELKEIKNIIKFEDKSKKD